MKTMLQTMVGVTPACHCGAPGRYDRSTRRETRWLCETHKPRDAALFQHLAIAALHRGAFRRKRSKQKCA